MPRKLELTWDKSRRRWKKKYLGKQYYFAHGKNKTDQAGYERALEDWYTTKAKVDADQDKPYREEYAEAIRMRKDMAEWHRLQGEVEEYQRWQRQAVLLERNFAKPQPPKLNPWEINPVHAMRPSEALVWLDRLDAVRHHQGWIGRGVPEEKTVAANVDVWLQRLRARVHSGQISTDRYGAYKYAIEHFRDWIGSSRNIEDVITPSQLESYHSHLLELIAKREQDPKKKAGCAPRYAKARLDTAKQFTLWLYERATIQKLPGNVVNRKALQISLPKTKPKSASLDLVKMLLDEDKSPERLRLWVLLMLNCGMYQGDLAGLEQDQVDWKSGRILRKRSKTERYDDVPTVNYKLWNCTFDLLQKHRSRHERLVLLNEDGGPLQRKWIGDDHKSHKVCNITSAYRRFATQKRLDVSLGKLRKTSSNLLYNHKRFRSLHTLFLGHSPRTVAEQFYVSPDDEMLDEPIQWLGTQYGVQ